MRTIDLVIPYVDNNDKVWQKTYLDYCLRHRLMKKVASMRESRYQDIGLINYQLKLVEKFMPFINNIYLILSNREQKPKELSSKVKVVYHHEFIPPRFLPTFNSTTIEMFLGRIKGLSEYFIYANDDMLPIGELKEDDFFTSEGKIKVHFLKDMTNESTTNFKEQCKNSYFHVLDKLNLEYDKDFYLRPIHSFTPMIKSHCVEVVDLLGDTIFSQIKAFRNDFQHNQYIYPIYEHFAFGSEDSEIDFYYSELNEPKEELIEHLHHHQIFCANLITNKENGKVLLKELENILCE